MKKYDYKDIIKEGYLFNFYENNKKIREIFNLKLDIEDYQDYDTIIKVYNTVIIHKIYINKEKELKCARFSSNRNKKCKRYASKIEQLLEKPCIFGTLQIEEKYINDNYEVWKKRIQRLFKKYNAKYVCNIDYGWKNERLHFHFIANIPRIKINDWQYGMCYVEPIKAKKQYAMSDYINKMSNHAVKGTTKNYRVMCNF